MPHQSINKYSVGIILLLTLQHCFPMGKLTRPTTNSCSHLSFESLRKLINAKEIPLGYGENYHSEEIGSMAHFALLEDFFEEFSCLLQTSPIETLRIKTSYENNCLHLAARKGFKKSLSSIIFQAKRLNDQTFSFTEFINAQNIDGYTALHLACRAGSPACVEKLLNCKPDTSIKNLYDETALDIATKLEKAARGGYCNKPLAERCALVIKLLTDAQVNATILS